MLIVSFYTRDYLEHAHRLSRSCRDFGYRYWIEAFSDTGSWVRNCARKGDLVWRALASTNEPVLWLDADAEIKRPLDLFDGLDTDFAVYRAEHAGPKHRFRSGTVWINSTRGGYSLAGDWAELCQEIPGKWDQEHLYHAWKANQDDVLTHWLPLSYCQRFDEAAGVPDPHTLAHAGKGV
jgi:hypothetical protein